MRFLDETGLVAFWNKIKLIILDNEEVTAISLNNLDSRVTSIRDDLENKADKSIIPLIIDVNYDDTTVPSGTFSSITTALANNREIYVRIDATGDGDGVTILPLIFDGTNIEQGYTFGATSDFYSSTFIIEPNDSIEYKITEYVTSTDIKDELDPGGNGEIPDSAAIATYIEEKTPTKPTTSTDNAVARYDGTTGNLQNSGVTIDDNNLINGFINVTKGDSNNAKVFVSNKSATTDYGEIFVSNADKAHKTRPLVLQNGYGNVGIGVTQPTSKLQVDGNIATTGNVTAAKHITSGGTSSQFVKGDGSLDSNPSVKMDKVGWVGSGHENLASIENLYYNVGLNVLAFLNPEYVTAEYTTDGGTTWLDYGASNAAKIALFTTSDSFAVGKKTGSVTRTNNDAVRVTISVGCGTYCHSQFIIIRYYGAGGVSIKVEYTTYADTTTFVEHTTLTNLSTNPGNIIIPFDKYLFGNNGVHDLRLTMTYTGSTYPTLLKSFYMIRVYSNNVYSAPSNLAASGHLYSFDTSQNATFPAKITSTGFVKSGGTSSQFLKADGSVDSNTYLTSSSLSDYVKHSNEQVFTNSNSCNYSAESIDNYSIYTTGPYQETVANGQKIVVDSLDTATIYLIDTTDSSNKKVIALDANGDISWTNRTGSPVVIQFGSSVQNTNISIVKSNVGYDEEVEYLEDMVGVEIFKLDDSLLNWTEDAFDNYYATYQSNYDLGELYQAMLNSIKLNKEVKLYHNNAFIPYLGYDDGTIHYCISLVSFGTLAEIHYWVNSDGTLIREEFIIQESDLGTAITKANSAVLDVTITQSSSTNAGTTIQVDNGTTYTIVSDTEPQGSDRAYKAPSWGAMEDKMDENELVVSAALNDLNTRINDLNDEKQDTLVSGTDIKTINNQSILGSGNIDITSDLGDSLVAMFSKLDEITPVRTIEYDIASTTGQIIFSRANVTEDVLNTVTDTLIYSIEITGNSDANIYAQYKVYAHFQPCPTRSPMTFIEHIHRNPAGTASLEGLKLLTYYYPKAVNNGYPYICYITAPAAGSRHVKIRVYLDSSNVDWKNPAIPVAVTEGLYNTTYLTKGSEMTITASGWITNGITQAATTTATVSTSLPKNFTANIFLAGEALTGGNLVYRALNDGKIYRVGTLTATVNDVSTNLTLDPMFGVTRIINSRAINANIPASDLDYKRSINPSTPNNGSSFQIETGWVKGDTMYYKCTQSGSSLIPTGHITSTLSPGYAYFPIGVINTASSMDFDCIGHEFVTLNSSGKVTHVNGLEIAGGSGGGGSQDLSDYVKYSNTISSTDSNGSCSSSETVEDNAIYTSGSTHYIINPGYTISLDVLSDTYTTYIINTASPKTILASGTGDIEWTNTTSSSVDVLVGSGTSGLYYIATIYLKGYTEEVGEIKEKVESISLFEIVTVLGIYLGDANEDGRVGTADISVIFLNTDSTDPKYDANNDGSISAGDYTYVSNVTLGKDLPYIKISTNPYTDLYTIFQNGKIPVLKIVIGQSSFYVVMNHDIISTGESHFSGRFFAYIKTGYYYVSCGSSYFSITPIKNATYQDVLAKQDELVSGTNIKTINGESILGEGNITIQGGGSGGDTNIIETIKVNGTALTPDSNKAVDIDLSGYDKAPLIIEVGDSVTTVPAGTYASITTALSNGRKVFVKVYIDQGEGNINYHILPLVEKYYVEDDEDSYYFSASEYSTTFNASIFNNDDFGYTEKYHAQESHHHGNIQLNGSLQFGDITIANGDKLVVTDASDNSSIARTSITFDGSTTTKALTPKGTWETFLKTAPVQSVNGQTGAVSLALGDTNVIETIKVNNTALTPTSKAVNITVPVYLDDLLGSSTSIHVSQDAFDAKANKATTLSGYGITDAKIANGVITLGSNSITPLTSHLSIKTINNNTITGTGNITIATPGTLKTDNTTALTTANNESLSGTVNLHKISKTGNYNDLIDKPTIPAAVTESTVSGWGFTKNAGIVTSVEVNGTTASLDAGGCVSIDAITGVNYASHPITATNGVVDILAAILAEINAAKVTIYSGTAAPSNSLGTNGDLYLQTS